MMNGTDSGPLLPVTNSVPSTNRLTAAPGIMIRVSRRRPTLSMIVSPTSWATR